MTDSSHTMTITDGTGSWVLTTHAYVHAYCDSDGGSNRLLFTSTRLPSLTVTDGLTLTSGNFDASASSGTFATSTGAVSLNGAVTASSGLTLSSGDFDASGSTGAFQTSTGAVTLKGATTAESGVTITSGNFDASASTGHWGPEEYSRAELEVLPRGAVVEEMEMKGNRLRFTRLSGRGPYTGWVDVREGNRELLVKVEKKGITQAAYTEGDQGDLDGTAKRKKNEEKISWRPQPAAPEAVPPGYPRPGRFWKVVGAPKEGLTVWQGVSETSPKCPGTLPMGAVVEEVQVVGNRLSFTDFSMRGPPSGWVNIQEMGRDQLVVDLEGLSTLNIAEARLFVFLFSREVVFLFCSVLFFFLGGGVRGSDSSSSSGIMRTGLKQQPTEIEGRTRGEANPSNNSTGGKHTSTGLNQGGS
ncbi:unnamed protein product [Effrenium voratum]|uniref:Uncharacterized protein n=1 Tax=Effrenium voratum TaxID=2562239 RepID=A0AA36HW34_9DINO|nr:unnamed protein product [Effrenium voratum]